MRSEYSANEMMSKSKLGKAPVAKNQGKHATMQALLLSWILKFSLVVAVVVAVKNIFF